MFRQHTHEFTLDRPPSDALPLFTPKGEEAWVPGWQPHYISPATGETAKEMLFVTHHGDETTYWTCMDWQPEEGHVRYLRLTPGTRAGFVDVQCLDEGKNTTRVRVTYQMHALSAEGRAQLEQMTEDSFASMIDGWKQLIGETAGAATGHDH